MLPWTRRNPQSSLPISVVDDVEKSYHNPHAAESLNSKSPDQRTVLCKESQESSLPLGMANVEAAKPDDPAAEVFNPRTATRFRQHTIMIQEYLWQASPSFRSLEELMKKVANCYVVRFFFLTFKSGLGKSRSRQVFLKTTARYRQRRS